MVWDIDEFPYIVIGVKYDDPNKDDRQIVQNAGMQVFAKRQEALDRGAVIRSMGPEWEPKYYKIHAYSEENF